MSRLRSRDGTDRQTDRQTGVYADAQLERVRAHMRDHEAGGLDTQSAMYSRQSCPQVNP